MSKNRKKRRKKGINKVPPVESNVTKRDKIIWNGILIIIVFVICFVLFLQFLKHFISI